MGSYTRRRLLDVLGGVFAFGTIGAAGTLRAQDGEGGLTFEVFRDARDEFRWRLKAGNGAIIATSGEGYKAKADCMRGIELVQKGAAAAKVVEETAVPK